MTPRGKLKWQKGAGQLRDLLAGARPRRHRLHRLVRRRAATRSTPRTGAVRWRFETDDHVYASPALGRRLVYIASTDGSVYARRPRRQAALALRHGRQRPLLARARARAARRRPDPLRGLASNGSLYALDAETGPAALVLRHHPARPRAARPQRPERLARARPPRRVHRRRARPDRPRALRLVPAPPRPPLRPRPGRGVRGRPDAHRLRHPGRLHPAGRPARAGGRAPRRSAPACSCGAAARRWTGRSPRPRTRDHQPGVRLPHPARRATATSSTSCRRGSCVPTRATRCGCAGGWAGRRRAGAGGRHDPLPHGAGAAPRAAARAPGRRRVSAFELSRLAVPLPPIVPSLNQIGFDSYDMVVGALAVSKPDARGRGLAAALGGVHQARPRAACRWPTGAARSPSRSRAATATTR